MGIAAVRRALPADVEQIARIQREVWRFAYAELVPASVLTALESPETDRAWAHTLEHGPALLFVATEGDATVGFCAAGPAPADDLADPAGALPPDADAVGMIGTLLVSPRWGRRGHGGRLLLHAAAALRELGANRGIAWLPEADSVSRAFYAGIGWQVDGTSRMLDAAGQPLREIRLAGGLEFTERTHKDQPATP